MKIDVLKVSEQGQTFPLDEEVSWFAAVLKKEFSSYGQKGFSAKGLLNLLRTEENITINGEIQLELQATCDRCSLAFAHPIKLEIFRHMIPYFESNTTALGSETIEKEEEIELNTQDLDFSYYHNDEIDLDQVIAEELQLALPMIFICREDCRGLCPQCGKNLNESLCSCASVNEASPFAVLKNLKTSR